MSAGPTQASTALSVVGREPQTLLSPRELHAYNVWLGSARPSLAPSLNAKLFVLYLQGKTCEDIRRLNEALTLGDIVAARVQGRWDERRDEHLDRLLSETSLRVQQETLETAGFLCDMLAVARSEYGEKFQRFLMTKDPKELGDLKIDSMDDLRKAIDMLQALTGQSRKSTVQHTGEVQVAVPDAPTRALTPVEAAVALKQLLPKA